MSLQRKLQALQYPAIDSLYPLVAASASAVAASAAAAPAPAASLSLSSVPLRTLVAWLEASKIRFLPVADRAGLQAVSAAGWPASFESYLSAMGCTRPFSREMSVEQVAVVLDWLVAQAVAAEYADHAGEYNSLSKMWFVGETAATGDKTAAGAAAAAAVTLDCTSPAVRAEFENEIQQLAQLFRLPYFPDQQVALLRVVRKRVEECIVAEAAAAQSTSGAKSAAPAAAAAGRGAASSSAAVAAASSSSSSSGKPPMAKRGGAVRKVRAPDADASKVPTTQAEVFEALEKLETGFPNTGDAMVEHAATVLRLLFLHDLRASQNLANELMMLAQEYTSDPKTDSKLGKVGV